MLKKDEARFAIELEIRITSPYGRGSDRFLAFRKYVDTPGEAGDVVFSQYNASFDKYDNGWRLRCDL